MLQSLSHQVRYFILNVLLVLASSLEIVSEVSKAASNRPPMMTRLLSSFSLQMLEAYLFSVRLRGSLTQPPSCTLHCKQLLLVDVSFPPPQSTFPDCTWSSLSSGSAGSSHVEFCHGINNSADCSAPTPPVIRMASEMKRFLMSSPSPQTPVQTQYGTG